MKPGGWAVRGSPATGPPFACGQVRQVGARLGLGGAATHLLASAQSWSVAPQHQESPSGAMAPHTDAGEPQICTCN